MSLVNKEDMTKLRPASEARSTAETAEDEIQLMAVAYAINNASNTGQYKVQFQEQLRDATKSALESNGYKIIFLGDIYNEERHSVICWDKPVNQQTSPDSESDESELDSNADLETQG